MSPNVLGLGCVSRPSNVVHQLRGGLARPWPEVRDGVRASRGINASIVLPSRAVPGRRASCMRLLCSRREKGMERSPIPSLFFEDPVFPSASAGPSDRATMECEPEIPGRIDRPFIRAFFVIEERNLDSKTRCRSQRLQSSNLSPSPCGSSRHIVVHHLRARPLRQQGA